MIFRLLTSLLRFVLTLLLMAGAAVLGWCGLSWLHGQPISLTQQHKLASEHLAAPVKAPTSAADGSALATVRSALHTGSRDRALLQLVRWASAADLSDIDALIKEANEQGDYMAAEFLRGIQANRSSQAWRSDSIYTARVLQAWSSGNRTACLEAIDDLPAHLRVKIPTRLLKLAALTDSASTMRLLGPYLSGLIPQNSVQPTLRDWAAKDGLGALAFARTFAPGAQRTKALLGVIAGVAATNPQLALQILPELPEEDRKRSTRDAFALLAGADPQAALQRWPEFAAHNPQISPLEGVFAWSRTDPQTALAWLKSHPELDLEKSTVDVSSGEVSPQFLAEAVSGRTKGSHLLGKIALLTGYSQATLQWARQQPDPEIRAAALVGLASYRDFSENPPTVAERISLWKEAQQAAPHVTQPHSAKWLVPNRLGNQEAETLSQEDRRLIAEFVPTLTTSQQAEFLVNHGVRILQPAEAMTLAQNIPNFKQRLNVATSIASEWGSSHPEELRAWLATLPTQKERDLQIMLPPPASAP